MLETGGLLEDCNTDVQHGGAVALRWRIRKPGDGADGEEARRISRLTPPNCDSQRARGACPDRNLQSTIRNCFSL